MKCYHIDAENKMISEKSFSNTNEIRNFIGGYLTIAYAYPNGDVLYVDDEGILKGYTYGFFLWQRDDQGLFGNGVLVGPEYAEDDYSQTHSNRDPVTTLEQLKRYVTFAEIA